MANFLVYGITGFTGSLISYEAVRRGYRPVLCPNAGVMTRVRSILSRFSTVFSERIYCKQTP